MYESYSPYIQSEIDYRRDRLEAGLTRRKRHQRRPRGRRSADTTTTR